MAIYNRAADGCIEDAVDRADRGFVSLIQVTVAPDRWACLGAGEYVANDHGVLECLICQHRSYQQRGHTVPPHSRLWRGDLTVVKHDPA